MSEEASRLLEWRRPDGTKRSLLLVTNHDRDLSDVDRTRFELCTYDSETDTWTTTEEIEYVSEILDFGIPENIID